MLFDMGYIYCNGFTTVSLKLEILSSESCKYPKFTIVVSLINRTMHKLWGHENSLKLKRVFSISDRKIRFEIEVYFILKLR